MFGYKLQKCFNADFYNVLYNTNLILGKIGYCIITSSNSLDF